MIGYVVSFAIGAVVAGVFGKMAKSKVEGDFELLKLKLHAEKSRLQIDLAAAKDKLEKALKLRKA